MTATAQKGKTSVGEDEGVDRSSKKVSAPVAATQSRGLDSRWGKSRPIAIGGNPPAAPSHVEMGDHTCRLTALRRMDDCSGVIGID